MPPKKRITKEYIINKAFELVEEKGISELNARFLAKAMGCSTQPIFTEFKSMDEVKDEVRNIAYEIFDNSLDEDNEESMLISAGIQHVRFAISHPNLSSLLFADQYESKLDDFKTHLKSRQSIIDYLHELGFNKAQTKGFIVASWSFIHGLSYLLRENIVTVSDEMLNRYIKVTIEGLFEKYYSLAKKDAE